MPPTYVPPQRQFAQSTVTKVHEKNSFAASNADDLHKKNSSNSVTIVSQFGPKGDKGDVGPTGEKGDVGPTGMKGCKGDVGNYGNRGEVGPPGPVGPGGPYGPTGPKGRRGHQGNDGPTGEKGVEGPRGPEGLQGIQGDLGPTGYEGPEGPTGPTGVQGSGVCVCKTVVSSFSENNIAAGYGGLNHETAKGRANSAFGAYAATKTTSGDCNTAVGTQSLYNNTKGKNNTAVGTYALVGLGLEEDLSPDENTAVGFGALGQLKNGSRNIGIGNNAGINYSWDETENIVIGSSAEEGENKTVRIGSKAQTVAYVLDCPNPFASSVVENVVSFPVDAEISLPKTAVNGFTIVCAEQFTTKVKVPKELLTPGMSFTCFCLKTFGCVFVVTESPTSYFYGSGHDKSSKFSSAWLRGGDGGRSKMTFLVDPEKNLFVTSYEGDCFLREKV